MPNHVVIPIILAGGAGMRLAPLSRPNCPKQFLTLPGDQLSLFQLALHRASLLAPYDKMIAVAVTDCTAEAEAQMQQMHSHQTPALLVEPMRRNTAAAIAAAVCHALTMEEDPLCWVMPSDHVIERPDLLAEAVIRASLALGAGGIALIGIPARRADPGFGYILPANQPVTQSVYAVQRFIEKPEKEVAQTLISQRAAMWNSGMFVFRARAMQALFQKLAPDLFATVSRAYEQANRTSTIRRLGADGYERLPSVAFDHLIVEKARDLLVCPCDPGWQDIGDWERLNALVDDRGFQIEQSG